MVFETIIKVVRRFMMKVHFDDGNKLYLEADYVDRATEHIDLIADILNKIVRAIKRT